MNKDFLLNKAPLLHFTVAIGYKTDFLYKNNKAKPDRLFVNLMKSLVLYFFF